METDRLQILKNVMFPPSPPVEANTGLAESVIAKNNAVTKEKLESAANIVSKTRSEQINSLLAILGTKLYFICMMKMSARKCWLD